MVYILETNVLENKKVLIEFNKVFGLSESLIKKYMSLLGISNSVLIEELTKNELLLLKNLVTKHEIINFDLSNKLKKEIGIEARIKSYKGHRRYLGLPLNGQKTRSNSRTSKKLLGRKR